MQGSVLAHHTAAEALGQTRVSLRIKRVKVFIHSFIAPSIPSQCATMLTSPHRPQCLEGWRNWTLWRA